MKSKMLRLFAKGQSKVGEAGNKLSIRKKKGMALFTELLLIVVVLILISYPAYKLLTSKFMTQFSTWFSQKATSILQ